MKIQYPPRQKGRAVMGALMAAVLTGLVATDIAEANQAGSVVAQYPLLYLVILSLAVPFWRRFGGLPWRSGGRRGRLLATTTEVSGRAVRRAVHRTHRLEPRLLQRLEALATQEPRPFQA